MSRWIQRVVMPSTVARAVCLPRSGGSARDFDSWRAPLSRDVELCAVQMPGRLDRYSESALSDARQIAVAVTDAVIELAPLPLVIFGDCMGALVAFEMARELRRRGHALPAALVVSSYPAPNWVRTERRYANGTAEELRRRLYELGDVPPGSIDDDELFELMLPTLRADFAVCEEYVYTEEEPLDADIHALLGRTDPYYSASDLEEWHRQTSQEFTLSLFDGGHCFLREGDEVPIFLRDVALRNLSN